MINETVMLILKGAILLSLTLYFVFALVVVRQVALMTDTVHVGLEKEVKILAWLHLIFVIVVFGVALITL